jgi:MFS family permease
MLKPTADADHAGGRTTAPIPDRMNGHGAGAGVRRDLPWGLAWRLSLGQIVAWGILYYSFTVVADPLQAQTGWSRTFINTGLSLGLLAWGLGAYPAGLWIQRHGARGLMTCASALGGGALLLMGSTHAGWLYQISWILLGTAMAGLLYDPAFAIVTRAFGIDYRRGITLITLVGGLASTLFIPLAQFAVEHLGWRHALLTLGALQIAVGVPLHAWGIPRSPVVTSIDEREPWRQRWSRWSRQFRADVSDARFLALAVWFAAHSAAFTGLVFQLLPMLEANGADSSVVVRALMFMGPLQVAGRLVLAIRGGHFSSLAIGGWAMAGLLQAPALLLIAPPTLPWLSLFAALLGLSNGVLTIARGTVVAELYGRERYAELNGALAAPAMVGRAAAPLGAAAIWAAAGDPRAVLWTVLIVTAIGLAGVAAARHR